MTWYEILFLKYLKGLPSKARMFLKLAKGGTMQLLPVNDDEPETSPFLGVIRYPDTSSDVEDEFTYKQSSYTGQARIKSIKGNTLVWNQLVQNGNFASTSGWSGTRGTLSASSNVLSYTITELSSNVGNRVQRTDVVLTSGHKYIITCDVKPIYTNSTIIGLVLNGGAIQTLSVVTPTANAWNNISYAFTNTYTNPIGVAMGVDCSTNYSVNDVIQFRDFMLIDLTVLNDSHITDYNSFKTYFPLYSCAIEVK